MIETDIQKQEIGASEAEPLFTARLLEMASIFERAAALGYAGRIAAAADVLRQAFEHGHKLLVFGNGGSAADAQHFCGELVIRFQVERRPLAAVALTADSVVLTAGANDYSYDRVFARQVEALGRPGDVAFGISTSGQSKNIALALQAAREIGMKTILLTGCSHGLACEFSHTVVAAPANVTARIQELHLATYHLICEYLDRAFAGPAI